MKKYTQLILSIVAVFATVAFVYYKHEYDRVRHTLEYLEVYGNPQEPVPAVSELTIKVPENGVHFNTAPHHWIVWKNLAIYSAFLEDDFAVKIRIISMVKSTTTNNELIEFKIHFENGKTTDSQCIMEKIPQKLLSPTTSNISSNIKLVYLICESAEVLKSTPHFVQISEKNSGSIPAIPVQENETRGVAMINTTCVCVFSLDFKCSTSRLIEWIAYYQGMGVEKFVFYGNMLNPTVRKLLDMHKSKMKIFYEEKNFDLPDDFKINEIEIKALIEKDCLFRHKNVYENVMVVKLNEFLVPRTKNSVNAILSSVQRDFTKISEFHIPSMKICSKIRNTEMDILLETELKALNIPQETGSMLLRPHLMEVKYPHNMHPIVQHIPSALAVFYVFEDCSNFTDNTDNNFLPAHKRLAMMIKNSLLYRKLNVQKYIF